jgi:hypothetical protein
VGRQQPHDVIDQWTGRAVVVARVVLLSRTGVVLGIVLVVPVIAGLVVGGGAVGSVLVVGEVVVRGRTVVDDGFGAIGVTVAHGRPDRGGERSVAVIVRL